MALNGEEKNKSIKLVSEGNDSWWYGGGDAAWASRTAALAGVPAAVRKGRTVGYYVSGSIVEAWWPTSDVSDAALVIKQTGDGGGGGTITVDLEFNPDSENPQSGIAVAQKISEVETVLTEQAGEVETAVSASQDAANRLTTVEDKLSTIIDGTTKALVVTGSAAKAALWDFTEGINRSLILPNADVTVTITNIADGHQGSLLLVQGSTGGKRPIFVSSGLTVKFIGSLDDPDLDANEESLYLIFRRGSVLYIEIKILFDQTGTPPEEEPEEPTPEQINNTKVIGYATQGGGITGGNAGSTITVSNFADLKSALTANTSARVVKVSGAIVGDGNYIRVKANKTIIGLPGSSLSNSAFYINNQNGDAFNIIIQNMIFKNAVVVSAVDIKEDAHHVWVDHCEFDMANFKDGGVDVTGGADYVTVSWCKFHTGDKGMLLGGGYPDPQSVGKIRVTVHHCYFLNCFDRAPSCRIGRIHSFNNYHNRTTTASHDYSAGAREDAIVRVESSYFRNLNGRPLDTMHTTGKFYNSVNTNVFNNCGANRIENALDTSYVPPYTYTLDNVNEIPDKVSAGAGATLTNPTGDTAGSGGSSGGSTPPTGGTDYGTNPVVIGYATRATGGAPTGGAAGATVIATTFEQLKSYAESSTPYVIKVSGSIAPGTGTTGESISVASNKTIIGMTGAELVGISLYISGQYNGGVGQVWKENVIIQNIAFRDVIRSSYDAIRVFQARRIWIDHCKFTNITGDGVIDITNQSDCITISYCNFNGYLDKVLLIGGGDTQTFDRGFLRVTVHHCLFLNCQQRTPRVRFGVVHVFNNLYIWNRVGSVNTECIFMGFESVLKIEKNTFETIPGTTIVGGSSVTEWQLVDNTFNASPNTDYESAPAQTEITFSYSYSDQLQSPSQARTEVLKSSGGAGNTLVRS